MHRNAVLAPFLLLWLLTGCSDAELSTLDARLAELRERPSGQVDALPQTPQYQAVSYDQADRRSPFRPERAESDPQQDDSDDLAPDLDRPRDPLEAYPLAALQLVGTLSIDGRRSALLRDPGGQVHRVYVGAHMGTDFGRIVSITDASVQLVEIVPNGQGGWMERSRTISLDRDVDGQSQS